MTVGVRRQKRLDLQQNPYNVRSPDQEIVHRQTFLLSALSHDDVVQRSLIPHWIEHYVNVLNIRPQNFLLILHSESKNQTGLVSMASWLRKTYGILQFLLNVDTFSAFAHIGLKYELLNQHVSPADWVMPVDSDEFVMFPSGKTAAEVTQLLDRQSMNVHYSLLVDRVAPDGDISKIPRRFPSILRQFPLNCAITLLVQNSDIRKVSLFRGYLRVVSGNHGVIGLNESAWLNLRLAPRQNRMLQISVKNYLGDANYAKLPSWYRDPEVALPEIRSSLDFGTLYHLKWIEGVWVKIKRRKKTHGQYKGLLEAMSQADKFQKDLLASVCDKKYISRADVVTRAFTTWEFMMLFQNLRPHHLENYFIESGIDASLKDWNLKLLLSKSMKRLMARDDRMPSE